MQHEDPKGLGGLMVDVGADHRDEKRQGGLIGDSTSFSWLSAVAYTTTVMIQLKTYQIFVLTRVGTPRCLGRSVPANEAEKESYACFLNLSWATLDLDELVREGNKETGKRYAVISLPVSCFRQFWARTAPWRLGCVQLRSPQGNSLWGRTAMRSLAVKSSRRRWSLNLVTCGFISFGLITRSPWAAQ